MGLFDNLKKAVKNQMLKVIEWEDSTKDTMVYRFQVPDRYAIMNGSKLIVRPSQVALFVYKGQVCDIFGPGSYSLSTDNIPFLTNLLALPYAFECPNTAEVYYVNTKQFSGCKWGTPNPVMMRDADFGNVRIRAFGVYSFKVEDAKKFMEEMFGTNPLYTTSDVAEQIKPMVVSAFTDAVAESKIAALDLAASYREFGKTVVDTSVEDFGNFGLKICSLVIENISLPEEVEKALDERTKLGIMSDKMGTYTQMAAADAMKAAASNPNGSNFASMGVGLGAGVATGQVFAQAMQNVQDTPKAQPAQQAAPAASSDGATKACPNCKAMVKVGSKFCPECGEKMPVAKFCCECGAKLNDGAKFCPECGAKQ